MVTTTTAVAGGGGRGEEEGGGGGGGGGEAGGISVGVERNVLDDLTFRNALESNRDETTKLARQLTKQVAHNNELLEQLTEAERTRERMQTEKHARQREYRQVLQTVELSVAERDKYKKRCIALEERIKLLQQKLVAGQALEVEQGERRSKSEQAWEKRFFEAQAEKQRLVAEGTAREQELARETRQRTAEDEIRRQDADKKVKMLMAKIERAESFTDVLRTDKEKQEADFAEERASYELRIAHCKTQCEEMERIQTQAEQIVASGRAQAEAATTALRQELAARTNRHVDLLGKVQEVLKQLTIEHIRIQSHYSGITSEIERVATTLVGGEKKETLTSNLVAWHEEIQRGMKAMTRPIIGLRRALQQAYKHRNESRVAYQEERAKTLMLEDQVSSLTLEASQLRRHLEENTKSSTAREDSLRAEKMAQERLRRELESQLKHHFEKEGETSDRLRECEVELHRVKRQLATVQKRHAGEVARIEAQLRESKSQRREERAAYQGSKVELETLRDTLQEHVLQTQKLEEEVSSLTSTSADTQGRDHEEKAQYEKKIAGLTESMRKLEIQMRQLRSLLSVVQTQRASLQKVG